LLYQLYGRTESVIISNNITDFIDEKIDYTSITQYKDYINWLPNIDIKNGIQTYDLIERTGSLLDGIFDNIQFLLSSCFIANYSEIRSNKVEIHINGMKKVAGTIDKNNLKVDDNYIGKIYNWIFSGSGFEDKLGIVRNVLSISINSIDELLLIDKSVFDSILSNHEIYLKENINQYLKVKIKIVDHAMTIIDESVKVCDSFINNYKNNFIAFFTFFVTVIILNGISTGDINNIFTKSITYITYAFILVSFLMMVFGIFEIIFKWKRKRNSIDNIKIEYSDILNKNDIDNIINKSKNNIEASKSYIIKNTIAFSIIWLSTLLIIFFVSHYLYKHNVVNIILQFESIICGIFQHRFFL
jgi:hypothetical protein